MKMVSFLVPYGNTKLGEMCFIYENLSGAKIALIFFQ